tara:strand:+ start:3994 stop:4239 length:246 start_codon:yes stop_codon:yes gene_type:complete
MEVLEILVADVFNNKESYKEGDYIVIMNILKEAYHVLKGDYGYIIADKELEATTDDEDYDYSNDYADAEEATYTGNYIESY